MQVSLLPKCMLFHCYFHAILLNLLLLHRGAGPPDTLRFVTRNREGSADTGALDMRSSNRIPRTLKMKDSSSHFNFKGGTSMCFLLTHSEIVFSTVATFQSNKIALSRTESLWKVTIQVLSERSIWITLFKLSGCNLLFSVANIKLVSASLILFLTKTCL